jgi:hypothetical protein
MLPDKVFPPISSNEASTAHDKEKPGFISGLFFIVGVAAECFVQIRRWEFSGPLADPLISDRPAILDPSILPFSCG